MSHALFNKQPPENTRKTRNFIKNAFSRKKGLRVLATNLRTPLTGRAETLQRDAERTRRKRRRRQTGRKRRLKFEVFEAGRAKQVRAHTVSFVSTLFETIKFLKRYVGGLVHSMDQPLHIAQVATDLLVISDYPVSASLFGRLSVTLVTKAQQTED